MKRISRAIASVVWMGLSLGLLDAFVPARRARADRRVADWTALVRCTVLSITKPPMENASVLIRGERIERVGLDIEIPADARVIDCAGATVTPGLIESRSRLGLMEIDQVRETVDSAISVADPIRASLQAKDAIDLRSPLFAEARRHGITSAVSALEGGLVQGRSAWVDLLPVDFVGPALSPPHVVGPVAMHAIFGEAGARAIGGSRAVAISRVRELLEDARVFQAKRTDYERSALRSLVTSRLDLEAMSDVLQRKLPLILKAHRASDILAAIRLAKEASLRIAVLGAEEAWLVADVLRRERVPVILNPAINLPQRFEVRHARADHAALLERAGVSFALMTESSHNAGWLRFELGNAVRFGLSKETALRSATLVPAEIYGMARTHGAIEPGRFANLVMWRGDPFEPSTAIEALFIRGHRVSLESRQTRLRDRYLERLGLRTLERK